ncbi:hypothetical protein [Sporosarcina sp. USHLN248]|uniref:hypothetical protein n=1 Tax=Sporosarcina sp. USHLN248 TaxID=3081300 RepID=UPI00301B07E9
MTITIEMSKEAYQVAKRVYSGRMSRSEGKLEINRITGMSEGSAQCFITIFLAMMDGEEYKRAFNNATNRFLIESIRRDYGEEYYKNAINAAQKHVDYYSTLGKGHLRGLQQIIDQMKKED